MFAAEKAYKKLAKTNTAQKAFKYVEDLGNKTFKNVKGGKAGKICAAVAEGLGFVAASIGGYAGAAKLGGAVLENKRENVRKQFENFEMMC